MIKFIITFCLLTFCLLNIKAQNHISEGVISDNGSNINLNIASISILKAKDSVLYITTRSDVNGYFKFKNPKIGKYILLVSYPKYLDYVEQFSIDSSNLFRNFGKINMILKAKLLNEIIIKGNAAAIKINGDTTEYNASAYKVEPNAKVEDLLKRFPGLQIDKNGNITANGKRVNKVLVDGEEFFGDDPTLVTRNIRADMVDKVQLFEKASDQAIFTGIDDGKKTTTLNVKLKENKKNGYFGKLDGGIANEEYHQAQGIYNFFKDKQKIAVYGTFANTGKTGLGSDDQEKNGTISSKIGAISDGSIYLYTNSKDDLDTYEGKYDDQGLPNVSSGGIHYNNKWKNKVSLNTNYKAGYIRVNGLVSTMYQNNIPNRQINTDASQNFDKNLFRQKLDFVYEIIVDTTLTLRASFNGIAKKSNIATSYLTTSNRSNGTILNNSYRDINNSADEGNYNFSLLALKKLHKKGRTLSLNIVNNFNNQATDGILNSSNKFFDLNQQINSELNVNQQKTNYFSTNVYSSNFSYTEPLSKVSSLIVSYNLSLNTGNATRLSYNDNGNSKYDVFDPIFSSKYVLEQWINTAGAYFNYRKGKSVLNFGAKVGAANLQQLEEYTSREYNKNFLYLNPTASYLFKWSGQRSIRISYNGNTIQPTLEQLQSVPINIDPLNVTMGNPNLKPLYKNSLNLVYSSYKVIYNQSLNISGTVSLLNNNIVNNITIDQMGKSTLQPINFSKKTPISYNIYANVDRRFTKSRNIIGLNLQANGNTSYNFINGELGSTTFGSYTSSLIFTKYKPEKYDYWFGVGPSYNINKSSFYEQLNANSWSYLFQYNLGIFLPWRLEIRTDGYAQFRNKTNAFNKDFHRIIINPSIEKVFFKSKNLKTKFLVNDLLNQNVGFTRNNSNGILTQTTYTTIKRYFLFSVTWDFNKMGAKN